MECLRNNFDEGVLLGGRYQTVSPLNHGSFGMVFKAWDVRTCKTVAIKCLTKKAVANDAGFDFAVDDKSEELVLHRRLGLHPNIVNLIESFETDAHVYLVLEFCPRGDLYEAIRIGHGPLETEHVRRFMLELIDAVSYIHSKGVYHRDIKPENIFLTESGSVKLGDFGLATTEQWSYESMVGSDRYMSPEQYDSAGNGYSPAQADVWAIGVCLLNILFSRNPFTTPTEDDPLFLDFSRDKQSLFDVFPSMSQDTYEVIVQCMNMDPRRRSLVGAREALERLVSFTTLDEALDDFCSTNRPVVASSNREPLRTPSVQSPQPDTGAFPWAKALQTTPPKPIRQLSAIPDYDDDDSYTEDLFSKSGATTDWMTGSAMTPSLSSMLNSSLGHSLQSFELRPKPASKISRFNASTANASRPNPMVAGSLPITMSKARAQSAMSLVFGRKEAVSKSWSDLWDEEEEEQENREMLALKEMNSRTWSHESKSATTAVEDDNTPRLGLSPATKTTSVLADHDIPSIDVAIGANIDEDLTADGFFFHDLPPPKPEQLQVHGSPKSDSKVDKWAVLGERRRAHTGNSSSHAPDFGQTSGRSPRVVGLSSADLERGGFSDFFSNIHHNSFLVSGHRSPANQPATPSKGIHQANRAKECPRPHKGRDWNLDWRKDKRHGFGDFAWVGGWQAIHS